jgi:hypothetical protein
LWFAGVFALWGALILIGSTGHELGYVFLILAAAHVAGAFFTSPPPPSVREDLGPGTLRATPARRFRATGWPPAKDADAYR